MTVKESVLNVIAESGENYVSGAQLADTIGVSRNAVWKAVKCLESEGFVIDSASSKGYRISPENNKLCKEFISAELTTSYIGKNIIVLDETDSTNNYAKKLASTGAENGTAVIADHQISGKGRLGRKFVSPSGKGLYVSIIIRPKWEIEAAQLITACTACAASEAVEKVCGHEADIKWVNDLYMNGKKICGILTEASISLETKSLDYAIIGIGINVLSAKDCLDSELLSVASSIEDEAKVKISRNKLCSAVLNELEIYLNDMESRNFLGFYRAHEILIGNEITANINGAQISGKAVGIDDNACLIMELPDGTRKNINSGEASLCRIKK